MFGMRGLFGVFAIVAMLAGCVETTGGGPSLATKGNLSPEAIRLLSQSEKLISLEQEQRAAARRQANFALQGGLIGGGVGALGGYFGCRLADCNDKQTAVATVGAGAAGAAYGAKKGKEQAKRQNAAAQAENALKRRIRISANQLTTARSARQKAQRVAQYHQRKLSSLKREVKAGRATKEQLQLARADARADAQQLRKASNAMKSSSASLSQKGSKQSTQLASRKNQITNEQNATTKSYNALVDSISRSAL